jgi:hypothetical protein
MARKRLLRAIQVRLTISDLEALKTWAESNGVSVGAYVRDMVRREHVRQEWTSKDTATKAENALAVAQQTTAPRARAAKSHQVTA